MKHRQIAVIAIIGLLAVAAAWPFKADAQSSQLGCAHLKYDRLEQMNRQSLGFSRRLNEIALALAKEEHRALAAQDLRQTDAIGSEYEQITLLMTTLADLDAYLFAAFELAGVRDHMVDSRDRAVILGQLQVVASEAKESSARALQVAGEIITTTKRPGVAAEASKAADFISQTRDALSSCAAETGA